MKCVDSLVFSVFPFFCVGGEHKCLNDVDLVQVREEYHHIVDVLPLVKAMRPRAAGGLVAAAVAMGLRCRKGVDVILPPYRRRTVMEKNISPVSVTLPTQSLMSSQITARQQILL